MAFEVKCSRCDRRYSGFRTRCPYCGARRSKKGKRAEDDNSKLKLIIGLLLIVILVVAVIVLIVMAIKGGDGDSKDPASTTTAPVETVTPADDVESVDSTPIPTVEPTVEPTPTEPPAIGPESVNITLWGQTKTDITVKVGDSYDLEYSTIPANAEGEAVWSSDNEDVVVVLQSGNITIIGAGTTTVRLKVGDAEASCIVRASN